MTADAARGAERPATQAVAPAPVMGAVAAPPGSSASEPEGTGARLVEADASEAAGEAEASARPRRRKRRRRRKKKPTGAPETAEAAGSEPVAGEGEGEGEAAPAATDSEPAKPRAERPAPTGPFHQFLTHEGEGGRRHTFASGSIVAGRVERIDDGVITLDLFGKGHAVMEVTEPRVLAGGHPEPELGPTLIHGLHTPPVIAIAREAWTAVADPEGASAADAPATSETAPDLAPPSSEAGDLEADAVETAPADGSSEADDLAADAVETAPAEGSSEASDVEADAVETSPADAPAAPAAPLAAASLEAAPEGARADALEPPSDQEEGADTLDAGVDEAGSEDVLEDSDAAAVDAAPVDTDELDDAEDEAAAPAEEPAPTFVTDSEAPRFAGAAGVEECAPPQPGDIIGGRVGAVSESGHMVIVNREVDRLEARRRIKEARDGKRRVAGLVFGFNRGGFDVLVEGLRVFCPASFMELEAIEDPAALIGRKLEFVVAPPRKGKRKLVVDRRAILKREARKVLKARLRALEPGQTVRGTVTGVREFGVLVDLGGINGLVHQSELSWKRKIRVSDLARVGEELDLKVIEVERGGKGKKTRVSLSLRALEPDPWAAHAERIKVGSIQKGKVVKLTEIGAFIELAPTIDGLLHISELGKGLDHAKQVLKVGEEVEVVIDRADVEQRRVSLSRVSKIVRAAVEEGRFDSPEGGRPSLKPGAHVKVIVDRVESGGVAVQVLGIPGRRGRGFIPNRELGNAGADDRRKTFGPGSELEVKIVQVDREGSLRCSVRALQQDEERNALRQYQKKSKKKSFGTLGELFGDKFGGGS